MIAAIALAVAAPTTPAELPDGMRTMIDAAYRTGDDKTIAAVVGVAKASYPDLSDQIDKVVKIDQEALAATRKAEQERQQERIAEARFLEIWKGELEAGASRSTGSTRTLGLYAAATLTRDGIRWRQKVNARIDYQQTDNVTTTERLVAAWQPQYKLSPQLYAFGLGQYERDRFLGYYNRETFGTGLGYSPLLGKEIEIDLQGGPAIRQTDFTDGESRTSLAGRGSVSIKWAVTPTLSFGQDGAVFLETGDTTASATTSLDTKLIGALKGRLSYNIQYERDTAMGQGHLDTISRATLVYSF